MGATEQRLAEMGFTLQPAKPVVANYIGCRVSGNLLFVSGRVSDLRGEVGSEISEDEAKNAARDTVLLLLAIIKESLHDLDRITGILKVQGFIRSAPGFTRQPFVLGWRV